MSVHARLRRIGFALLCRQPGLRADPEALADALKWAAAARRRLDYNGRIVSAAGAAALGAVASSVAGGGGGGGAAVLGR